MLNLFERLNVNDGIFVLLSWRTIPQDPSSVQKMLRQVSVMGAPSGVDAAKAW
jgi:hypothetical protein